MSADRSQPEAGPSRISTAPGSSTGKLSTDVNGNAETPLKRSKQQLSCAECRRLKLKCDREVPCSNCVRRQCAHLCPDGTKETRRSGIDAKAAQQLQRRISALEGLLAAHGVDVSDDLTHKRSSSRSQSRRFSNTSDDNHTRRRAIESPTSPRFSYNSSSRRSTSPSRLVTSHHHHSHAHSHHHQQPPSNTYSPRSPSMSARQPSLPHLPSIQTFNSGGPPLPPPHTRSESTVEPSHGTLVIGRSGRSRYLGPSAGTEWLKNQELGGEETPVLDTSPRRAPDSLPPLAPRTKSHTPQFAFPFADSNPHHSTESLLAQLPAKEDAEVLVDAYYRYFAWNHDVAPRPSFQRVFDQVFKAAETDRPETRVHPQQIALVYTILALGTVHNLELPPHDESAEEYIALGKACLSKGDFLNHGTIAGVQALMGLHRDGARWNLPEEVVEERRRVFWEAHTIEVFQANCFSRPSSLVAKYIDTAFPSPSAAERASGVKSWTTLQYEICQLSAQTALLALPSVYPDPEMARQESPEVSRRNLHRTLQQFTLALNISENILFLQRPYFVMAMHDQPIDPTRSMYGHSYLAVVERCNIVAELYRLHPTIIARQWFFWYHLFTAAVCLGTLILKNPQSVLATFALSQIDQAINVFSILIKQNTTPSMVQNHDWLIRLRQRAINKVHQAQAGAEESQPWSGSGDNQNDEEEEEDRELLGWRTRLIERGATGASVAVNIHASGRSSGTVTSPPTSRSAGGSSVITPAVQQVLQQHFVPSPRGSQGIGPGQAPGQGAVDNSTDFLLHQFWDPMMMSDGGNLASANWWSWDFGIPGGEADIPGDPPRSQPSV
ncbi:hypothetical protein IAR55_005615 [Kwoniella newhampshirensis]|uniref:Zn(2)-C6 fungal-type domain-containing protein n=1 Tax=Kwoniella newhampshirensis TaxID=1651941 RepID=A0AAW0YUV1_9TREE